MAAEDFFESEVAMAAAATAAMFSPRVRGTLRQGLVYGLAGVDLAARAVSDAAVTVGRGVAEVMPIGGGGGTRRVTRSTPVARPAASKATTRKATGTRTARATKAKRTPTRTKAAASKPAPASKPAAPKTSASAAGS